MKSKQSFHGGRLQATCFWFFSYSVKVLYNQKGKTIIQNNNFTLSTEVKNYILFKEDAWKFICVYIII